MKQKKKMTLVFLVMVVMIFMLTGAGPAITEDGDTTYNIEIVVDASGSLKHTDPENNRYTAIEIFLQTLQEQGNHVGAVVFTTEIQSDTELVEMSNKNLKENLINKIQAYVPGSGDTDIGLGLKAAVDRLVSVDNDSDDIILLISDGNTDLGSVEADEKSLQMEKEAVDQCVSNDIQVYGICLNSNGKADPDEFRNITQPTGGEFLEVSSSENLVSALKDFYGRIFRTKFMSDTKPIQNGEASKSIEVPSYGVEELNITIDHASKLSQVIVTQPGDIVMSENEFKGISSMIGDYYFVKIRSPKPGLWKVTARGEEGTNITFDFVFNSTNRVGIEAASEDKTYSLGESATFLAGFYQNGEKLIGQEYYEYYSGTLVMNELNGDDELQYFPMEIDGDNGFKSSVTYDKKGRYEVWAVLNCGEFESSSDSIVVSVGNALPVFESENQSVTIKIKKLFKGSKKVDIAKYFSDQEGDKLTYTIISTTYDNDEVESLEDGSIILNNLTDGQIVIEAKDIHGDTVTGEFEIKVTDLKGIVVGIGILVIVLIIVFLISRKIKAKKQFFEGYLNVYAPGFSKVIVENDDSISMFTGRYKMSRFGIKNHNFDQNMYFQVVEDKSIPGNASHKLKLVSSKPFYYQGREIKELDMNVGMICDIRSSSPEDPESIDDTITITLEKY